MQEKADNSHPPIERRRSFVSNNSIKGCNYKFFINDTKANKLFKYKKNSVSTTKYNLFTFLPKTLLYQYVRPYKVYYLLLIILENIPAITPIIPISTMVPYFIVLIISIIREGVEDYYRYKFDKELNGEKITVHREGIWKESTAEDLRIGELVMVKKNARFPADMILIDSDKEEGVAFIETSSLDGELTLKKKFSPLETAGMVKDMDGNSGYRDDFPKISGMCKCEEPNVEIFSFNGVLELDIGEKDKHEIAVNNHQMLLKGAVLKSNEWVVGIVVYAGHNTKLVKNLSKPKEKESKVFKLMSLFVIYIFFIQAAFCWISAGLNYYFSSTFLQDIGNIPKFTLNVGRDSVYSYFSYLIIYKFMIPITLYVTFELVRLVMGYLLQENAQLYSHYKHKKLSVGTVSIIEELGAVNYVFTDKTGTLTCNKMEMKYCVIGDKCYEYLHKDNYNEPRKINVEMAREIIPMFHNYAQEFVKKEQYKDNEQPQWKHGDYKVVSEVKGKITDVEYKIEKESMLMNEFWTALTLANECVAEDHPEKGLDYVGLSPDDVVLVRSAANQGFVLQKLDKATSKKVKTLGEEKEFEVLHTFEFTSDRKKLSIIVRDQGVLKMYIKGADTEIRKILSSSGKKEFEEEANYFVDYFSKCGLRTLLVGMKVIDETFYQEWKVLYERANKHLEDKITAVRMAQEMMEKDIHVLGATIVEDRLQDEVPETIRDLRQAGIKIWMITGDKMDTAYNIGVSCNLINKDNQIFFAKGEENEDFTKLRKEYAVFVEKNANSKHLPPFSIVLDSIILNEILESKENEKEFIEISNKAVSVVCCRVSPLQKSDVVRIMKKHHPDTISLAIGDGGNDVSMILQAHIGKNNLFNKNIGIGVYGEEGLRAVQSADFAIGEFKILRNLLLIHGRECHIRMNNMILIYFYKCFIFCLVHFLYGFYNLFSAQTIYDDWLITFYNIGFTFFPIVVKAFSDWQVRPDDGSVINDLAPELYKENRDKPLMNYKSYFWEIFRGIIHCLINFFFTIYSFNNDIVTEAGQLPDLWYLATILYFNLINLGSMRILITARNIITMTILAFLFTTYIPIGIAMVGLHFTKSAKTHATYKIVWESPRFYLVSFLVAGTCLCLDLIEESYYSFFGEKLYLKLLNLIKEKGSINNQEELPQEIRRMLGSFSAETTSTGKRQYTELAVVMEVDNFNKE